MKHPAINAVRRTTLLGQALVSAALALGLCQQVSAQAAPNYPTKPVRLIVPFAPGGSPDVIGREVAQGLTALWGQSVIVDNRAGAGGIIGADAAAKAAPDGYTLFLGTDSTLVNAAFFQEKMPYDAQRDFTPVAMVATFPLVLISNLATGIKTFEQFISTAKAKPGILNYASAGIGSSHHLSMELLSKAAGLSLNHVAYKGGAPALQDLLAGHLPVMFSGLSTSLPFIKAGKVNVLAIGSLERSPLLPDVPTISELGFPGFEAGNWVGVVTATGTPPAIVAKIQNDLARVTRSPAYRTRLSNDGNEAQTRSGDEFGKRIRSDMERNGSVLRGKGVAQK